ncbi:MAG: hypothetical protein Q9208_004088 [Pyrenodesmia sp. 3 TL-2023]
MLRAHFTRYGALPKAARGGRPFIDGVLWWSGSKVLVSEVGKFFPVKGERRLYLTDDDVLSLSVPEYDGNLSDVSPWEWRDRKRVKVYKVIKSFIEDHIIAQKC